jgi:hypothetical protein
LKEVLLMTRKAMTLSMTAAQALFFGAGCNGGDGAQGGGSTDAAPAAIDGAVVKSFRGFARDYGSGEALEGAMVCVENVDGSPCELTDAEGGWLIEDLPAGRALRTVVSMEGFAEWPYYQYWVTMLDNGTADALAALVAGEVDPNKGAVILSAYSMDDGAFPDDGFDGLNPTTPLAGVSFEITPESGVRAFVSNGGIPDVNLTETQTNGLGGYAGMAPGEYDLSTTFPTALECNHDGLVPGEDVKIEVRAGHITGVWLRCIASE